MENVLTSVILACGFMFGSVSSTAYLYGTDDGGGSWGSLDGPDICRAYCDKTGVWRGEQRCTFLSPYCCGSYYWRYCCSDESDRGDFSAMDSCPSRNWWPFTWSVLLGIGATLTLIAGCVAICCYHGYCCRRNARHPTDRQNGHQTGRQLCRRTADHVTEGDTLSYAVDSDIPRPASFSFNPQSPAAWAPPPYDSLPKEPPKYADIFSPGQDNVAFDGDTKVESGESVGLELSSIHYEGSAAEGISGHSEQSSKAAHSSMQSLSTSRNTVDPAPSSKTVSVTPNGAETLPATPSDNNMPPTAADNGRDRVARASRASNASSAPCNSMETLHQSDVRQSSVV